MNKNNFLYVVTMYRYANKEEHSYVLGVYDNPNEAIKHGKVEESWRGNKYTCEVLRLKLNDTTTILMKLFFRLNEIKPMIVLQK